MTTIDEIVNAKLRLKQMKLSGFKSFVDLTTLHFPSHLVGVVGPNGCGKSNIIDAVRWVMGESSAKSLRAETGTDVIFNGSTDRKPVGQAMVELIFDNPPGAISGEYAQFRELSIKRVLDRDGQSTYFLNHVRCRRRDITDLFLGTGLGARSYAVIEQGMISRLIEAKPDELRVYLEEAAGISRYHERRRETEISIKHTRENITRLSDLSQELAQQLERLAEQAKKAQAYRAFQHDHKQVQHDLLTKQWYVAETKRLQSLQTKQTLIADIELKTESLATLEHKLIELREFAADRYQTVNELQDQFYQLGADVGRIEEQVAGLQANITKAERELQQQQAQSLELDSQLAADEARKIELEQLLAEQQVELANLQAKHQALVEQLTVMETTYQESQQTWQQLTQTIHQASTQVKVLQTHEQQEERQQQQLARRLEKLNIEQAQLKPINLDAVNQLQSEYETQKQTLQSIEQARQETQTALSALLPEIKAKTEKQTELERRIMQQETQLASLTSLQQTALGQDNQQQQSWLTMRGLADKRLGQLLTVEPRWAKAVEALLGDWLQAVVVDESLPHLLSQGMPPHGSVFIHPQQKTLDWPQSLASVVDKPALLPKAFEDVYVATHLSAALELLNQLDGNASVLLPDGLWLSRDWIRVPASHNDDTSILSRAETMTALGASLAELQSSLEANQAELSLLQQQQQTLQAQQTEQQDAHQHSVKALASVETTWKIKQAEYTQAQAQQQQWLDASSECQEEMLIQTEKLSGLQAELEEAQEALAALQHQQQALAGAHEAAQQQRQAHMQQERECQQKMHALSLQHERSQAELAALIQRQQNRTQQQAEREQRLTALKQQLLQDNDSQSTLNDYLQAALHKRLAAEKQVAEAKETHTHAQTSMTEVTALRQRAQRELDSLRTDMAKLIAEEEAESVRQQHWQAQAESCQYGLTPAEIAEPTSSVAQLTKRMNELQAEMTQLEPVNLAAIEEYQETDTRYTFLQTQQQDLLDALNTLEQAIQKMDKETRTRLTETFEQVNTSFQTLFPRIFGGGSAYLSLTEEELLTAGITVMARPPGKRNTSIHLLSGGEKALTAIALVFAIFQLNPAPFCLLDEVDAPLDEANVHRYCELIRHMSKDVQFIFISHNRVTMELANQLVGVTMKEPGVSRLVAVDLAETMDFIEGGNTKAGVKAAVVA